MFTLCCTVYQAPNTRVDRVWVKMDKALLFKVYDPTLPKPNSLEVDEKKGMVDEKESGGSGSEWILLHLDYYSRPIEEVGFATGMDVMFEYRMQDGSWVRNMSRKQNWQNFKVGDFVDCAVSLFP
jgi:hypothetical protein